MYLYYLVLLLLAALQLSGLALFARAFFPYKTHLHGFANIATDIPPVPGLLWISGMEPTADLVIPPQFDRLVFMMVDALREDFVYGDASAMSFVKSIISKGEAFPYIAIAEAPTVTLPRIKALTTGSIPSFLDAILNIAESDSSATLLHQDNWLAEMRRTRNKTIHFFGDDTWIKLFPDLFGRSEGTTSFYVTDTTEVDLNVTRNVLPELAKPDWDVLIFHYLGLDHIGHTGGPKSPLMKSKQKEMDDVARSIYESIIKSDAKRQEADPNTKGTLFVLCGDHGMNEIGNHGGSSSGEVSPAFLFIVPEQETDNETEDEPHNMFPDGPTTETEAKELGDAADNDESLAFPVRTIKQIDVVPTLALLFGVPIPKNSLGKVVLDLFTYADVEYSNAYVLRALQLNAHQLSNILRPVTPGIGLIIDSAIFDPVPTLDTMPQCNDNEANKNKPEIYYGCMYLKAAALHDQFLRRGEEEKFDGAIKAYWKFIDAACAKASSTVSNYNLSAMYRGLGALLVSAVGFGATTATILRGGPRMSGIWHTESWFVAGSVITYCLTMFASSFVEEEHLLWYYVVQTMWVLQALISLRAIRKTPHKPVIHPRYHAAGLLLPPLAQLFLLRLIRGWNQTGQKRAGDPDIRYLLATTHGHLVWHLLAATLAGVALVVFDRLRRHRRRNVLWWIVRVLYFATAVATVYLTLAYKVRAEKVEEGVPAIYRWLIDAVTSKKLSRVTLGLSVYWMILWSLVNMVCLIITSGVSGQTPDSTGRLSWHFLLLPILTPLLILLSRPHNVALFALFSLQLYNLRSWLAHISFHSRRPLALTVFTLFALTHASFFATGNSNSIASIDLSNAYVGVEGYDVLLVGVLTFLANWAGSVWWIVAGWGVVMEDMNREDAAKVRVKDDGRKTADGNTTAEGSSSGTSAQSADAEGVSAHRQFLTYAFLTSTFYALALLTLSLSVTILRNHIFIWTVFSPKYLYQISWTVLAHWSVGIVIGGVVVAMFEFIK